MEYFVGIKKKKKEPYDQPWKVLHDILFNKLNQVLNAMCNVLSFV